MTKIFEKTWDSKNNEEKIYKEWEKAGYFKPEGGRGKVEGGRAEKPFVISMPPPNVTGKLHMGHALFVATQDIMTRYHRLLGEPTLWVPGTDHAGIATQTVVDKQLRKEGINKNELGREEFLKRVWQWKEEYGNIITGQIRRLGASCDWSRERFTLDEGLSSAVKTAFVDLYNKGLIYRGEYIVNWCPKCHTAIADDEVEHEERESTLYYFRYAKNFPITIATTRPETKLGDVAVAVNPTDKRYKEYISQSFEVDIDGVKRTIQIIDDKSVDMTFGTGAVGVTPAHSFADWKMADDHNLPKIKIIDENARLNEATGKYAGLKVLEAREKLVEYFKANDLLEKEEKYLNNLSICYRCGGTIEPLPSKQWFVKMKPLAEKAKKVVKDGEIKIIPARFDKVYFHWMDNIRDWCISRQLWWGHQIPVWYRENPKSEIRNPKQTINSKIQTSKILTPVSPSVIPAEAGILSESKQDPRSQATGGDDNGKTEIYVGINPPQGEGWVQDSDVLDTWFSAALWPFSTLGWPDKTDDFKTFYPTTVMETGYDILFFWVARMIMFGLEFTGEIPFETVYLHGLVRDEKNRKMSKSLGNVLDPLDLIAKYGTDAVRMAVVVGSTPGQDLPIGEGKVKGYRNFSNKIWNASRFVTLRISEGDLQTGEIGPVKLIDLNIEARGLSPSSPGTVPDLTHADKDILAKLAETKKEAKRLIDNFKFSLAGELLYEFFWHVFADIYIEQSKSQLLSSHSERSEESSSGASERMRLAPRSFASAQDDTKVKAVAFNTKKVLFTVLSETLIMLHPFVPFVTEAVWQELREIYPDLAKSIMIANWPE